MSQHHSPLLPSYVPRDRRLFRDRRQRLTQPIDSLVSSGRRERFRRRGEDRNSYLDHLSPEVIFWAFSLLLLSATDASLTLIHIHLGGEELVPTMRWALGFGSEAFVAIKMSITAIGILFLAIHEHFRIARISFRVLTWIYISLMLYHLFLIICAW